MLPKFLLTGCLIVFFQCSFAQIRATTESGNKVLLYDNGSWKYEEKTAAAVSEPTLTNKAESASIIKVDSTKTSETKPENFFYETSPRLERYFEDSRSKIRCKINCSNTKGTIKIKFIWEFPVTEGNRYFGMFKEGSEVTMTTTDGQNVTLVMGDENTMERLEKKNYSVFSNTSQPLTEEQLAILSTQSVKKVTVAWKGKPEEYRIESSSLLKEMLPKVL